MQQTAKTKPKLVDNVAVTEQFADDLVGYSTHGDVISLTFAVHRPTHSNPPEVNRVVTARVALTTASAMRLHEALSHWRETAEARSRGQLREAPEAVQ